MNSITQQRLASYLLVERDITKKMKHLSRMRESIMKALKDGTPVQDGEVFCYIKLVPGRRSVSWKKVVVRLAGEAYAKRVLAATKPGPEHKELIIE